MLNPEKEIQLCEDVASIKNQLVGVSKTLSRMEKNICEDREKTQKNSDAILAMETESKTYSKIVGGIWALVAFLANVLIIFFKG